MARFLLKTTIKMKLFFPFMIKRFIFILWAIQLQGLLALSTKLATYFQDLAALSPVSKSICSNINPVGEYIKRVNFVCLYLERKKFLRQ